MTTRTFKATAAIVALATLGSAVIPVSASAHDRHSGARHYGGEHKLTKNTHRKFHNRFGRGSRGTSHYREQVRYNKVNRKRRNKKGELIAAGVIGLAIGAIIASETSKREHKPNYTNGRPDGSYSGSYGYQEPNYESKTNYPVIRKPTPVESYPRSNVQPRQDAPQVITFNDPSNLQPWTAGWREWCGNNYRSFNAQTGTFRGYDGLDHFCVPK